MVTTWNHKHVNANNIDIHYVRHGTGMPLVLLHGWPEFWFAWHKNIGPLAEDFDVVAPDLRGFGDTEKPGLPDPSGALLEVLVEDLKELADALSFDTFGIVTHDVGSFIAQAFARKYPDRVRGLFFFNCVYPGIGRRWLEPDSVVEIWYQTFNQQPWVASLVGRDRETCKTYFRHFLNHWAHRPGLFDQDLEIWTDNFMKPGNVQGGFNWYVGINEARMEMMKNGAPELAKIEAPTRFLWGAEDPIIKPRWTDRIGDYFSNYELTLVPNAGHFVHYERPDLVNREVRSFFSKLQDDEKGVDRGVSQSS